ncbi:MAG: oxygenase MpaB family protein, partial [Actinomycetota bacterium]
MARNRVAQGFRRIISGDSEGTPEWVRQLADGVDSGYFGPGSAAWTVHGSLPTLVGGVRALLMQALHPGALAGVVQHSRYEEDPLGRLAGTTQWLTVVTFGDTAMADRECARVRGMHRKVRGMYPVGGELREYSAGDPDLLRWVHVAFTDSFLATHRVWGGPIPGGEDAYVREWAKAGELVGVDNPPRSVAELQEQIRGFG